MVLATRSRGPIDTPAAPLPKRFDKAPGLRRALAVAMLLHLPFVPSPLVAWLHLPFLSGSFVDEDRNAEAIIPVDFDLTNTEQAPKPPTPPPAALGDRAAAAAAAKGEGDLDGGSAVGADGGRVTPPKPKPVVPVDGGTPSADAGPPSLGDPIAAAGAAGRIAAKEPNLQVYLAANVLRKHPVGTVLSRILSLTPEWQAFFQDSSLEPVRDFNHILITGPHFVGDLSKIVAVMDLNVAAPLVRDAIEGIVHRNNGVWLDEPSMTAARARVNGVKRIFALLPERRLLAVLPDDARDQLGRLKYAKGFKNAPEGIVVSILRPQNAVRPFFALPESIQSLRIAITPTDDGGADVALEATDRSALDAAYNAPVVTREFEARRRYEVPGLFTVDLCSRGNFEAVGDRLRGRVHVPAEKVQVFVGLAEAWAENLSRHRPVSRGTPRP